MQSDAVDALEALAASGSAKALAGNWQAVTVSIAERRAMAWALHVLTTDAELCQAESLAEKVWADIGLKGSESG